MSTLSKETIELCQFELVADTNVQEFIQSSNNIGEWLTQQPGFKYRCLSQQPGNKWADIVHWDSMEDAQRASEKFVAENGDSFFMRSIDTGSLSMNHYDIETTQAA